MGWQVYLADESGWSGIDCSDASYRCRRYGMWHSKTRGIISSYLAKICTNENQEVIYVKYLESNEIPREIFYRSTDWI